MFQLSQDVSPFDARLAEIDRRLREIQADLVPRRTPRETPAAPKPTARAPQEPEAAQQRPVESTQAAQPPPPATPGQPAATEPPAPTTEPTPQPVAREQPTPPKPSGRSGPLAALLARAQRSDAPSAVQLDRISQLTVVYAELLGSLRDLLEAHLHSELIGGSMTPADPGRTAAGEESIALSAGPFDTLESVRVFERRLASLPGVRDVTLRGYQGEDRAVFDVRLDDESA